MLSLKVGAYGACVWTAKSSATARAQRAISAMTKPLVLSIYTPHRQNEVLGIYSEGKPVIL